MYTQRYSQPEASAQCPLPVVQVLLQAITEHRVAAALAQLHRNVAQVRDVLVAGPHHEARNVLLVDGGIVAILVLQPNRSFTTLKVH
jgi:hypothetical protein